MKVVAVMASHERPEITKVSCNNLIHLGCEVVLVVTNLSDVRRLSEFKPLSFNNTPLGSKWQFAVNSARKLNPDILVVCGSDDILHEDYLINALKIIDKGYEFVGVSQWYMDDGKNKYKAWYSLTPHLAVGSGRVYTKQFLDRINWEIFDVNASRRLDDKANEIKKRGYVSTDVDKDGLIITAIKGKWQQLNPINKFFNAPTIGIQKV